MYKSKTVRLSLLLAISLLPHLVGAENPKDQPLVAALLIPTETLCMSTENIEVVATISFTNRSDKNILLKMSGGRNVTVLGLFGTRTLKPILSSWMSMSDQAANEASVNPTLHPGETTNYQLRFRLSAEVLAGPGFYKVQVSYDAVAQAPSPSEATPVNLDGKTNWVIVQVRECAGR